MPSVACSFPMNLLSNKLSFNVAYKRIVLLCFYAECQICKLLIIIHIDDFIFFFSFDWHTLTIHCYSQNIICQQLQVARQYFIIHTCPFIHIKSSNEYTLFEVSMTCIRHFMNLEILLLKYVKSFLSALYFSFNMYINSYVVCTGLIQ